MLYYFNIIILSIFVSLSYANNDLAQLMLPSSDIDMNKEKQKKEQPAEEAPAEEVPVEEEPAEEAPIEEAPVKEEPAEEKPAEETIKINTLNTENSIDFKDPYELSFGLGLNLMNGYFFQEHFSSSTYLNVDVLTPIELFKSNKLLNSKIGGGIHMYNFKINDDSEQAIKATECSVFSFLGTINKKISNINLKFGAGFSLASVKTNNEEVSKTGITIAGNISYTLPLKIKNIKLKLHAGGMSSIGGENDIWNYKVFTGFYEMINLGLTGTYILL